MKKLHGVKIALVNNGKVVTILRDDIPTIVFPNMWELPGGGCNDGESAFECASREVAEELGITLQESDIVFDTVFPSMHLPGVFAGFMVAYITDEQVASIVLGDEGQEWKMMTFDEFMNNDAVIPQLKERLQSYLDTR